jgi:outer membrane immunogenic protein
MRSYLSSAALLFLVSPVVAADYFHTMPPEPQYFDYGYSASGWSGQYLGVTMGSQRTRIEVPGSGVLEGFGLVGGVFAGVNYEQDNWVYGLEADAEWPGFRQSMPCANPAWTCNGYLNTQGSLRARLGFAVDAFHVYGTAGLAIAHVGGSTVSPTNVEYPNSYARWGWTAGVGAEVAFSDQWFGRAEYRYTDLGTADAWFDVAYPNIAVSSHALRAGVGYRF